MPGKQLHTNVQFWRDEGLPGVEARLSTYRKHAFRTHIHAEYSVGLIEQGSTRFPLGGTMHTAQAGQMVFIHPNEPHACNPDTLSGISYRMFYIAPGWLAGATAHGRAPRFVRPVVDDPELYAAWRELHEAYVWGAPLGEKQALLLTCLRELIDRHADSTLQTESDRRADDRQAGDRQAGGAREHQQEFQPLTATSPQAKADSAAIARARKHLAASVGVRVPLDELAQVAGLSRHHFARSFKAATGLPPHCYQLQLALEHAKRLLAGGLPISQAALDAGFADQSHFSRLFRQFTCAPRRQYVLNTPCDTRPCETRPCEACPEAAAAL